VISRENAAGGEVEYESLIGQQMVIEMWREKLWHGCFVAVPLDHWARKNPTPLEAL
jgi:hypothetical protein